MQGHCPQQGITENGNRDRVHSVSKCNQYHQQHEKCAQQHLEISEINIMLPVFEVFLFFVIYIS